MPKAPLPAQTLAGVGQWNPFRFDDLCHQAHRQGGALADFCVAVQRAEWDLLLAWCYRQALGQ